jgi:GNAT superfamily N-acetyltransferase
MQRLASRLWPLGLHPGGLGWAAAIGQLADRLMVADDGDLIGWAGLSGGELSLQVDPGHPAAASALIDWAREAVDVVKLQLAVAEDDEVVRAAALAAGFAPLPGAEPGMAMRRDATAGRPPLPEGYRIRSVEMGEAPARVAVHRAAWRPAALPWPPGDRPAIPEDATSTFTAAHYEMVCRTWLYDRTFDLVAEAPNGSLAACCIAWWDEATGCAEIEPLGVVPEHRRRGLAGALCLEVAAMVAELGGHEVFINTGPNIEYSTPAAAYAAVGFQAIIRNRLYQS